MTQMFTSIEEIPLGRTPVLRPPAPRVPRFYTIRREQFVEAPLDGVFSFFSRPENLGRLTPADLGFSILTPSPIHMKPGAVIDYTIKLWMVRLRWTTLITAYDPPGSFADTQVRGPYAFWHHVHTFSTRDNGTVITDDVQYAIRFGWIGRLVHSLFVRKRLRKIFDYRRDVIAETFAPAKRETVTVGPSDPGGRT